MKMPISAGIDRPFSSVPVYERYLAIGSIEDARGRICRMIERGEGLGIVVGPPGTGKTLLCQRIAAQFRSSHLTVMLGDIRVTSRVGMLQQVMSSLGQAHRGLDEHAMEMLLVDCLTQGPQAGRSLLLIIDEAQLLSIELLEEIRMLTNLIREGRQLVQTILVGGPKLEDPLADPQMESLSQRIIARCYLHPMNQAETCQYIRSMLAVTGLKIDDDAIASVHHACGGVPRLINQLMNQSLDFASQQRKRTIDESCVQHAWADLQQLPSPVIEPRLKPHQSSIEFGELDDESSPPILNRSVPTEASRFVTPMATSYESTIEPSREMRYEMPREMSSFEFDSCTQSSPANYVDFESILASKSIVCLSDSATGQAPASQSQSHYENSPPARPAIEQRPAPIVLQLKTTNTTIVPTAKKADRKAQRDELFGIDFSDEMLVDISLADAMTKPNKTSPSFKVKSLDPAAEEISLHGEILQMSRSAMTASDSRSPSRAAASWEPVSFVNDEADDTLPIDSVDVPSQMAVVWHDDEPLEPAMDDRDMLVIEDEVTIMVDRPSSSAIGSGAMRQPTAPVEQHYQNLFSRLRTGQ